MASAPLDFLNILAVEVEPKLREKGYGRYLDGEQHWHRVELEDSGDS
jgi:hypothetical protein